MPRACSLATGAAAPTSVPKENPTTASPTTAKHARRHESHNERQRSATGRTSGTPAQWPQKGPPLQRSRRSWKGHRPWCVAGSRKENDLGKNRGHGEGTIWQMPDGRWRGEVSVGWRHNEHGQSVWKRKTVSAKTRGEVADKLKKLLRDQQRGLNIDPNKQTVAEFLTAWLEDTVKPSVRPKTYRSYEQMVRCHLVKNLKPEEI